MTARKRWIMILVIAPVLSVVAVGVALVRNGSRSLAVRVEALRDEDGDFHRRWTFTSEHGRWESYGSGTRNGEHTIVLDLPGAFDSTAIRLVKDVLGRGAGEIVYEVEARRLSTRTAPGRVDVLVIRKMRGNAGGTPSLSSSTILQVPEGEWGSQFRAIQAENAALPLPAKVQLGVIGGSPEVIEFP